MKKPVKIMIVAGEASGDAHAAKLVSAMRAAAPELDIKFFGAAGGRMREVGVDSVVDSDDFSIVGLPEIASALPMFLAAYRRLKREAVDRGAHAAILVDFPEFNLKLARALKRSGIKVIYYISPQLWAWRQYRVRTIRKYVDLLLTILPFEKDWYSKKKIHHVEYVGSPLAREVHSVVPKKEFCRQHGLDADRPIVALLPGSRHKEIVRILPEMLSSAVKLVNVIPQCQFVVALADVRQASEVNDAVNIVRARGKTPPKLTVVKGQTFDALNAADAAAVTSGTATLETGIIGTPMAIVYKTSAINYKLVRPLISVEHFGLINLIAGARIAKEMIQDDFTADALADELARLLDPGTNRQMRRRLADAAEKLGQGGASARAAAAILNFLSHSEPVSK